MTEELTKVCGIDVHKNLLVVTVLDNNENYTTRRYQNNLNDIYLIRSWIMEENCKVVAFESTGNYWLALHRFISPVIPVIVANAYFIKHVPGKKTDEEDSKWIARLALGNLLPESRIMEGKEYELRSLTRYRKKLVEDQTYHKNLIHNILDCAEVHLSVILTDIFGKTGMFILNAIANCDSVDSIVEHLPPHFYKRKDEIIDAISKSLNQPQLLRLRSSLNMLACVREQIKSVESEITTLVQPEHTDECSILCSIPGFSFRSASIVLSEIGNIYDFKKPENLASFAGLVPTVYQSANVTRYGSITKHGDSYLRWIMVECAQSCARKKGTHLYSFFERVKKKVGYKKAIVALARKLLTLIWHLLMNKEFYNDNGYQKNGEVSIPGFLKLAEKIGEDEAIQLIQMAKATTKSFECGNNVNATG